MAELEAKKAEINLVLSEPDVDLWKLRELCLTEGGLVDDTLRKRAWPKLVGLHSPESLEKRESSLVERQARSRIPRPDPPPPRGVFQFEGINQVDDTLKSEEKTEKVEKKIAECVDADQIDRDTARCTWHLLSGSQRARRLQMQNKHRKKVASILRRKQVRLSNFINLTLVQSNKNLPQDEHLRYYQGFHDVASVFLSSLGGGSSGPIPASANASPLEMIASSMGLDLPSKVLGQVAKSHFRDAMRSNFIQLQSALRLVLFPLLARFDPELHAHLYYCDMEPFFALSWVITWFSHDIRDTALVKRLFDAFIVSHPLFPLYLSAAMILHPYNRNEILSTDCDFAAVHHTLSGLPKNSSMVGWRFKVTDGYVSGDEVSTASTDMDSTFLSEELYDLMDGDANCSMASSMSGAVGSNRVRVPFQELIDTALSYMRRVPPRKLMGLATRYFAEDPGRDLLFQQAKSISLLQSPPSWGLAATSPADWVLTQRMRESRGLKSTNGRLRRNRSRSRSRSDQEESIDVNDIEEITKYLDEKQRTLAVIATGYGPGDDDEEKRRKRRKMLMWGAVAVAFIAVSYAVATQYGPSTVPVIDSDSKKQDNSVAIERDLFETRERPRKPVQRVESPQDRPVNKPRHESARMNSSHQMSVDQPRGDRSSGQQNTVQFEVNPKGFAESVPGETSASERSRNAASSNSMKATFGSSGIMNPPSSRKEKIDYAAKYNPAGTRASEEETTVSSRYVKSIVNGAKGMYQDARHAIDDLDPDFILPGVSMVPEFLRKQAQKARQAILGGEGVHFVKETINETKGKGNHLVRDALVKLHSFIATRLQRFFASDGRGSRLLKAARRALNENEAEIVAL